MKPFTRKINFLAMIAGAAEANEDMKPRTRKEKYLAKIAGKAVDTPAPRTAEEYYLSEIAKNGGGGGGDAYQLVTVNIVNNALVSVAVWGPFYDNGAVQSGKVISGGQSYEAQLVLLPNGGTVCIISTDSSAIAITASGDATVVFNEVEYTGDFTVTIETGIA